MTIKNYTNIKPAIAALVILVLTLAGVFYVYGQRVRETTFSEEAHPQSETKLRDLSESGKAEFVSVFVFDPSGKMTSYMVASGTEEFTALTDAIAKAEPADGIPDQSFSNLLVISFGANDTLNLPYSPDKNLVVYGEKVLRPAADISPVIAKVKEKLNY